MRIAMIDAAYALGDNDHICSIEAGKFADFDIPDADPRDIVPMAIKDHNVLATMLAGKVILKSATHTPDWQLLAADVAG